MNSEHETNNEIRLLHEDKEFIMSLDILDPNGNPLIVENNYDNTAANFNK